MTEIKTPTNAQLFEGFKAGDQKAFTETYRRFSALMVAYGYRKIKDKQVAQNIVEGIFKDLYKSHFNIWAPRGFAAFLFSVNTSRVMQYMEEHNIVLQHPERYRRLWSQFFKN